MKYRVALTITMEVDWPGDITGDLTGPQFFFEEHLCVNNLLDILNDESDKMDDAGRGCHCYHADVKYLGIVPEKMAVS